MARREQRHPNTIVDGDRRRAKRRCACDGQATQMHPTSNTSTQKTSEIVCMGNPRSLTRPYALHAHPWEPYKSHASPRRSIVRLNDMLASRWIPSFHTCKPNRPNAISCAMFHRYMDGCRRHRLSSITHGRTQPWMLDKGERFTNHLNNKGACTLIGRERSLRWQLLCDGIDATYA